MKLIPWGNKSPTQLFSSDLDNWMEEFFKNTSSRLPEVFQRGSAPALNLADTTREFVVTVELPGVSEKDISVQIVGQQLVISGERKWEDEKKDKEYYRVESQYGAFRRAVPLPEGLNTDADAVRAKLEKGVLEVRIPKVEPKAAASIKVQAPK
jgi:HSP20 family protein